MKNLLLYLLLISSHFTALSQQVMLDSAYNGNGKVVTNFFPEVPPNVGLDQGVALAIQPDNKIIVGGICYKNNTRFDYMIARYNTDGSLDSTFGTNGLATADFDGKDDNFYCLALQPDGKIIAGGRAMVDTSLANNGGSYDFALVRFNTNGSIDQTFGNNGRAITDFYGGEDVSYSIVLQPDGKIIAAGYAFVPDNGNDWAMVRYNANGALDNAFGTGGKVELVLTTGTDLIQKVLLTPTGGIVVIGGMGNGAQQDVVIGKYTTTGNLDPTFSGDGIWTMDVGNGEYDYLTDGALQPDGKIVATGTVDGALPGSDLKFLLLRLNANGTLDNSFGTSGITVSDGGFLTELTFASVLQPDGKIVLLATNCPTQGYYDVKLFRYTSAGLLDTTFNGTGMLSTDVSGIGEDSRDIAIQPDGKLVVTGCTFNGNEKNVFTARYINDLKMGLLEFTLTGTPTLLYPNPLQNTETLKYTLAEDSQISIALFDNQGKLVTTFVENENQGKGDHEIELTLPPTLPNGTYFIQIASPGGKISIKAIK